MKKKWILVLAAILLVLAAAAFIRLSNFKPVQLEEKAEIRLEHLEKLRNQGIGSLYVYVKDASEKVEEWAKNEYHCDRVTVKKAEAAFRLSWDDPHFMTTNNSSKKMTASLTSDLKSVRLWTEAFPLSEAGEEWRTDAECTYAGTFAVGEERNLKISVGAELSYDIIFWKGLIPYAFTVTLQTAGTEANLTVYDK